VAQLENIHLFLFAEQLLWIAEDVLDAWISERPLFRRVVCGGARLGVRRIDGDGALAVSLGSAEPQLSQEGRTFPEISPRTFVTAAVRFARELAKSIALHDPSQHRNLRLSALLHSAKALRVRLEECTAADSITNPEPENYRSFGIPARRERSSGPWSQGGKMRFLPRWVATVPDIDLSATFLCGELLLVGSARQLACLHRNSGAVLWRRPAPPAASVVTPAGLVRIQSDGTVRMHELASGETQFATYLAPRPGRGPSGALVHAPGLPKLLVLAEGERSVTAIDLVSGDVRWRYTARRPAGYRLRRAGKLMIVSGGDSALMALDVVTGEVVWRLRDRLPFSGDSVVDRDAVYAIAGGPVGPAKLHHIDVWSGNCVWSRDLGERPMPGQAPLLTPHFVVTITRDRRGVGVSALDRQTGEPAWEHEPGLASATTAWLAIDDALLANSASGTLLCLDSATGRFRYSHVFARHIDADQPRRFEPVLRGGALFIPQHQVHVVRPRDGEILGTVPSDLIPDLLRVDERCDVYIAEQSGHLAAFGAAPRLTLVK
jgi:outer membrane protein assembly factor BamB